MPEHPSAYRWFEPRLELRDDAFLVVAEYYFVVFQYRTAPPRPYIATLCGPSGRNTIEDSPPDHLHHHGVWWGHGDVGGVDFYLDLPGGDGPSEHGTIEHREWDDVVDESPRFGFTEALAWRRATGETLIDERRSIHLDFGDDSHYTVDLDSTYTAAVDLRFGDTKESVLPGIRPAEVLTPLGGGRIVNSAGGEGEAATMGRPADWLDVSGRRTVAFLGGEVVEGVAILNHPGNPQHPARFFSRDYGPISPFPGHHFHDDRTLVAGRSLRLRHRLVVHRGDADDARIADQYVAYVNTEAATGGEGSEGHD